MLDWIANVAKREGIPAYSGEAQWAETERDIYWGLSGKGYLDYDD